MGFFRSLACHLDERGIDVYSKYLVACRCPQGALRPRTAPHVQYVEWGPQLTLRLDESEDLGLYRSEALAGRFGEALLGVVVDKLLVRASIQLAPIIRLREV